MSMVYYSVARKENVKSSAMNSMHYPAHDTTAAMRPLSPTELSRYGQFVSPHQHQHQHGSQSSCPVHGHEPGGHQHDERNSRPPGIPFDPPNHVPRDFHAIHAQHPRIREELQFLHGRHPLERKEHIPSHHALEEDLRRRGLDYRWAGVPPHLLDEQYRRHILNGGHEHTAFKEPPHGQVYLPHFYYGRDYPIPVEPYMAHGIPAQNDVLHRHGPAISPRLLDYYRRGEHGLVDRSRNEFEAERRAEERREKERNLPRTPSVDSLKSHKKCEEVITPEKDLSSPGKYYYSTVEKRKEHIIASQEKLPHHDGHNGGHKMPFFKGLEINSKPPKTNDISNRILIKANTSPHCMGSDMSHQANSITSLLSSKLPDPKTELAAASILANMNRINQSPCSDEVESLTSSSGTENHLQGQKPIKVEDDGHESATCETEQFSEEKLLYMATLGLVPHNRKRALEDDYERKRWDRKFRKFRGRPKKRSKRENTEDSSVNGDTRPSSELDFYSGPMTRHKQQMLQEQECLLEQIQKRNNSDTNEDPAEDLKLDTNKQNIGENSSANNNPMSKEGTSDNKTNFTASMVKSFSQNSNHLHGDSSSGSVNSLFPSRLIAILQQDKHQNSKQGGTSVENLTQVQRQQLIDDIKKLDRSLFGQTISKTNSDENFVRWPGVEPISLAYSAYIPEYDVKRQQLMKRYEELERDGVTLQQKREYIQKNLVVYHDRRMNIAEKRRELQQTVENIHSTLRTILNS